VEFEPGEFYAICLIILLIAAFFIFSKYRDAKKMMETADKKLDKARTDAENNEKENKRLIQEREKLESEKKLFDLVVSETKQTRPILAKLFADAKYEMDMYVSQMLRLKSRPAQKAADEVKQIAKEKRELIQTAKQLQYQLLSYERVFPWLEEFKEIPAPEAAAFSSACESEEYDVIRNWLSPEEYEKLSTADKFQLAFDRWKKRKKTAWEVGIEYERYVGYRLEKMGFKVKYLGATLGLEDMGRDLLAAKKGATLVIQCKRWAKEKTVHEKHICQLCGSVTILQCQHPEREYKGLFVTSASVSDLAKKCADHLKIGIIENCKIRDYPMIKCNISKEGEKIYHLPFDQQYDRVEIAGKTGSFYAWTTREAEAAGFRRAYRWHPDS